MKKEAIKWNLDDMIKEKDFDSFHKKTIRELKNLSKAIYSLSPNMKVKDFKNFIKKFEKVIALSYRVTDFSMIYFTTHLNDDKTLYYQGKSKDVSLLKEELQITFERWAKSLSVKGLKKLDTKNADRLFKAFPEFNFLLEHLRESKKHSLPLDEEKIITKKNTNLKSPLLQLYSMITNEFSYEIKLGKSRKPKKIDSVSELAKYIRSNNPAHRRAAYQAMFSPYKKNLSKLFNIYQAVVRDWSDNAAVRKYKSPISIRNFSNNIEDRTIETLMDVCSENRTVFQEYFRLKARELKVKKLKRYDIYAPIGEGAANYTFKEAKKKVFEVFKNFTPGFYNRAKLIFDDRHVDSHPRKGKRSGAFCATVTPKITPYVLLNFNGKTSDMMTMAHELGHGIHSLYSNKLSILVRSEPLPLAETASTFSEMLVFDKLVSEIKDKKAKKAFLFEKIASSYATILRQNYFVKFEIAAYNKILEGVTGEELCDLYYDNLKEQFGNSIIIPNEFRYEWSYIPHIFRTPFYCYAYNFGELLSMSLYAIYKQEGKSFIPKIERILSAGGSEKPSRLLNEIGIDINSKEFWQGSFKLVRTWIDMLKEL